MSFGVAGTLSAIRMLEKDNVGDIEHNNSDEPGMTQEGGAKYLPCKNTHEHQ